MDFFRLRKIERYSLEQVHIAPLVVFRIIFGGMMLGGVLRFWLKGWIEALYIEPEFFFTYYGFEWVHAPGATGMYMLFLTAGFSALFIMLGLFYRWSALAFFLSFTYIELIDKSTYLNHYYFISIVALLMVFLPAGRFFSLDTRLGRCTVISSVPRVFILIIQIQLGIVYFYAGIAKLNWDWLFEAQPLRIWLQAHTDLPLIGGLLDKTWIAFLFSWFGAIYDLSIPFFLLWRPTRIIAFMFVVIFHVLTSVLFQIGMFPYIMILSTLIFFSEDFHLRLIAKLRKLFSIKPVTGTAYEWKKGFQNVFLFLITIHFVFQVLFPFRFVLYPGKLFWTEEGYRFSWRVMLVEKAGKAFFHVSDPATGRRGEAMMDGDLTVNQEKMMAIQPDMILQYAHHLEEKYKKQGIADPVITVESYVTLNGGGSRPFINKYVDLTKLSDGFHHKWWVLPYEERK